MSGSGMSGSGISCSGISGSEMSALQCLAQDDRNATDWAAGAHFRLLQSAGCMLPEKVVANGSLFSRGDYLRGRPRN